MHLAPYRKAVVAVIGVVATFIFDHWGTQIGLPPDWPQTVTLVATPIAVYFFRNDGASS